MMSDIAFNDCINEQRFIDINIHDTETEAYSRANIPSKKSTSIFNFISNSATSSTIMNSPVSPVKKSLEILTKSKSVSLTRSRPVLTATISDPTIKTTVDPASRTLAHAADILLSKLNDIDLNSSENDDDDDDEELNQRTSKNKDSLKNYLESSSYFGCSSTPMRAVSTSSTENLNIEDSGDEDLNKTLNSVTDQNDETLSFKEESQDTKLNEKDYRNSSPDNKNGLREMLSRNESIVDDLLGDIYDRFNISLKENFTESDVFTDITASSSNLTDGKWVDSDLNETSNTTSNHKNYVKSYHNIKSTLRKLDVGSLRVLVNELTLKSNQTSTKLIKQLRQKDKLALKMDKNCDVLTSILQARSLKRSEAGFVQWKDAMKALARLPGGVPKEFRKSVWLNLSKHYIKEINLDWNKVRRIAFNDRSNPDDHELGIQIVKDLHRTGCSGFSGSDNEQDRALLKRVLLAFARYNKSVGYCQGFNIIAAQILEIVDKKEEDAFMCMIYLIDCVLPEGYFTNSMRTLAIDMAVFRELLKARLPKLCHHLNALQFNSISESRSPLSIFSKKSTPTKTDSNITNAASSTYEPPLTNVFTMQWFLTLFATCLPKSVLLRVWDCLFLEGAEVLFRSSIAIWDKLAPSVLKANSADSFYSMMSILTVNLFDKNVLNENEFMAKIYSYGPFPLTGLVELREKFMFNITPFQSQQSLSDKRSGSNTKRGSMNLSGLKLSSNDDGELLPGIQSSNELSLRSHQNAGSSLKNLTDRYQNENDDDEVEDLAQMISCFALIMPNRQVTSSNHSTTTQRNDIMLQAAAAASAYRAKTSGSGHKIGSSSKPKLEQQQAFDKPQTIDDATPGAFSYVTQMYSPKPLGEELSSDLNELKKQYQKLKERQRQAFVIVHTASDQYRKQNEKSSQISSQNPELFSPKLESKHRLSSDFLSKAVSPMFHHPETDSSPIVNHLLIKPEDRSCNTVKRSITLINTSSNHTVAEASPIDDSYSSIKKNLVTFNTDCLNYIEKSQVKTASVKKPYFSDDESSSDDDVVDQEVIQKAILEKPSLDKEEDKRKELLKYDSHEFNSISDGDFKEMPIDQINKKESVTKSHTKLKKKLSNDSKLIINHLCHEEKIQMTPFNPFSVRQLNANVAKNGMRLGLYK